MTGKWTKGEWRLAELHALGMYDNDGSAKILAGRGDDSVSIASVSAHAPVKRGQGSNLADPERDANAHLMAASPAMFAALEAALRQSGCDGDLCGYQWHEDARQALSQALGEGQ